MLIDKTYACKGSNYYVKSIKDYSYIATDTYQIIDAIEDTDIAKYKANMKLSVDQELAYSIYKDTERVGYVYNYTIDKAYYGASINIQNPVAMILGLKTMFEIYDSHKISFVPHKNNLKYFKSLALGSSIREYHNYNTPVAILRDALLTKGRKAFFYMKIEER